MTTQPVRGELHRLLPSGSVDVIPLTTEQLEDARNLFGPHELPNVIFFYADGSRRRPWRFIDPDAKIRQHVDEDGNLVVSF